MKVVVHTHRKYKFALEIMLTSLNHKAHIDDIIISIADVPDSESEDVKREYRELYGLRFVVTSSQNIDELTAYVALGEAMKAGEFPDDTLFLMLHDTCEAGRLFWNKLDELERNVRGPDVHLESGGATAVKVFKLSQPVEKVVTLNGHKGTMQLYTFAFVKGHLVTMCAYEDNSKKKTYIGMLTSDCNLTQNEKHAVHFADDELDTIRSTLKDAYVWFPIHDNFNIGVASRKFILERAHPALLGKKLTKAEGIDVEINSENPLNLRNLAAGKWRYTHCAEDKSCKYPIMSLWTNDTDVYGDGKRRNVSVIHVLDLKKYSVLVGVLGDPVHPARV